MDSVAIIVNGSVDTVGLGWNFLRISHLGDVEPASVEDALALAAWFTQWAANNPDYLDTDAFKRLQDEAFNNGTFRSM